MTNEILSLEEKIANFKSNFTSIRNEIKKVIVGMDEIIDFTLASIFANGHVLLEGVPGLGKTLLVKTIAQVLGLDFKRIQFTPDLMPSDLTGTLVLSEEESGKKDFVFKEGPLFSNIILADEINRATPKTQSALLEAMEEKQISSFNTTYKLNEPFFVLATQNPIELEGTYVLPEAQLDRFLIKLYLNFPEENELMTILEQTTGAEKQKLNVLSDISRQGFEEMKTLVKKAIVPDSLLAYVVRLISEFNPQSDYSPSIVKHYVAFCPGPRGAQSVIILAKVFALLNGRVELNIDDVKKALLPALRHRLVLNFQADVNKISSDLIISEVSSKK